MAGTALSTYVADLAEQLGTYVEYTTSTLATSGEAARLVLIDELRDDEEARDFWGGGYVYARTGAQAGTHRRVLREGYHGPLGGLLLSRPYDAALAAGVTVALSEPLPYREYLGVKGLTDIVNESLRRLEVEAIITFTGDGTRAHSLAAYPFIRSAQDVLGVKDHYGLLASDPYDWTPWTWDITTNGSTVTLDPGYAWSASDTFQLIVPVPADSLIYDGASWAYSDHAGLVDDDDQAAAKLGHVRALGMVKALQEWAKLIMRDVRQKRISSDEAAPTLADIQRRRGLWARAAHLVVTREMPKRRARARPALVGGSPLPSWP